MPASHVKLAPVLTITVPCSRKYRLLLLWTLQKYYLRLLKTAKFKDTNRFPLTQSQTHNYKNHKNCLLHSTLHFVFDFTLPSSNIIPQCMDAIRKKQAHCYDVSDTKPTNFLVGMHQSNGATPSNKRKFYMLEHNLFIRFSEGLKFHYLLFVVLYNMQ